MGNKVDLESQRMVSSDEVKDLCKKYEILHIETSCKENKNIEETILVLVYQILCSFYELPSLSSNTFDKWDHNIHHQFPLSFKISVSTFLNCLNCIGFNQKNNLKIPKFVLFEIIRFVSIFYDLIHFVKEFSKNEKYKLKKLKEESSDVVKNKKKKKDCFISWNFFSFFQTNYEN